MHHSFTLCKGFLKTKSIKFGLMITCVHMYQCGATGNECKHPVGSSLATNSNISKEINLLKTKITVHITYV